MDIEPNSDDSDANWEVPVVGDWYKAHEGALRAGIFEELKKYVEEIDENANSCGIDARLNDNIITNEEILLELRKINPRSTVNQVVKIQESEFLIVEIWF